ncbi:DUF4911 domain-containing protein [Heliobacterium chlorum]|uniref:DUF4911 domain-containing protein n=1 Tax=Heliobacterium chlorum TaxID=2698 RepID=A0ABR7T391_HELCL|nr:DUF4911 domain-containing protein [Heliobacterium chlorum]MBC9784011.1 DUF4911 domain-containing protein [Heliobacterium chlorum]
MSRYKGKRQLSDIYKKIPSDSPVGLVRLQEPQEASLFLRIMEGYSHLAMIVPLYPDTGWYSIYTTPDNRQEVESILSTLPVRLTTMQFVNAGQLPVIVLQGD